MNKELILIAGGTASGKTYIANKLKEQYILKGKTVSLIEMDNYYKTLTMLGVKNSIDVNWDEPSVFDLEQLKKDIDKLMAGETIKKKRYNYETCEYNNDEEIIYEPSQVIIIEGLFALYDESLRAKATRKIFVNTDPEIRMMRRIKRDSTNRQKNTFNIDEFMNKWEKVIKPMHTKFIHPTKEYADIVVKNNYENEENESLMTIFDALMVK